MNTYRTSELDVIMMTFREPRGDDNWKILKETCPWAQRVDGVKGFDRAHKAAARLANTPWLVTVDGDTQVNNEFWDLDLTLDDAALSLCFRSQNKINGLAYGNGGVKVWNTERLLNINSHENANHTTNQVDFCWLSGYSNDSRIFSMTDHTGSEHQALRAGFREGVKLSLVNGERRMISRGQSWKPHPQHLRNLIIWTTVGSHAPLGIYGALGTLRGWYRTLWDNQWDINEINDYDNKPWETISVSDEYIREQIYNSLGYDVSLLDSRASEHFATWAPARTSYFPVGQGFEED